MLTMDYDTSDPTDSPIINLATEKALELLGENNTVTEAHAKLVRAMAATMVDHAMGFLPEGRWTIAAPVGTGKTTVLACVCWALAELTNDVGLLILQEKVESGADTIEKLIVGRLGMDRELIGHCFREGPNGERGMSAEQARERRFVVATHQRARMQSIVSLLEWERSWCDVVERRAVVDEVLHVGQGRGYELAEIAGTLAWASKRLDGESAQAEELREWTTKAGEWLDRKDEEVHAHAKASNADLFTEYGRFPAPGRTRVPGWSYYLTAVSKGKTLSRASREQAEELRRLLEALAVNTSVRFVVNGAKRGGAILQHRRILPDAFRNLLILDAGAEVDQLRMLDVEAGLAHRDLPHFTEAREPAKVKDWRSVTVDWLAFRGGQKDMMDTFRESDRPWYTRFVADWLASVPFFHVNRGPVLIVTHKSVRELPAFREQLRNECERVGFAFGRLRFTHWGAHDGSNAWQDCVGGVALGVRHLPRPVLQGMALAQLKQPAKKPTPNHDAVLKVQDGMTTTQLYQAIGRCRSRQNEEGGIAKPAHWLVVENERRPRRQLKRLLPQAAMTRVWSVGRFWEATDEELQTDSARVRQLHLPLWARWLLPHAVTEHRRKNPHGPVAQAKREENTLAAQRRRALVLELSKAAQEGRKEVKKADLGKAIGLDGPNAPRLLRRVLAQSVPEIDAFGWEIGERSLTRRAAA